MNKTADKPRDAARETSKETLRDGSAPLYQQVVRTLREEILRGTYSVGTNLPTEGELRTRFGVSRHTVREALRQLRNDGLVSSRQGSGTTVMRPVSAQSYVHEVASIADLIAYASQLKLVADTTEVVTADARLAEHLDGKPGQRWLRIAGYRHKPEAPDTPVCWSEVYVDGDYAGVARLLERRPGPIYELIEDMYGEQVDEVEQLMIARPAPEEIAATLSVKPGDTVIEVRRTYRLTSKKVAEIAFSLYPSDRFRSALKIRRVKG